MKTPEKKIGLKLVVMEVPPDGYVIMIEASPDYHRLLNGYGVRSMHTGKSGWEALTKMAQNWKNTGFLD